MTDSMTGKSENLTLGDNPPHNPHPAGGISPQGLGWAAELRLLHRHGESVGSQHELQSQRMLQFSSYTSYYA